MTALLKLAIIQFLFTLIYAVVVTLLWGQSHGFSALLGGLICASANLFFSGKLFLFSNKKDNENSKQNLRYFYRSESLKIALTITKFVLVFLLVKVEFLSLIVAYLLASLMNLFCLPILK